MRVVVHLINVEFGLLSESSYHAPSVRGVFVLFIYVVLVLVRWDVDTSMFLRIVASPKTLNG